MLSKKSPTPSCEGSASFEPDAFFEAWPTSAGIEKDNLESLIKSQFGLKQNDSYVYHAVASVTLTQVQRVIGHGGQQGLHAWYRDTEAKPVDPPPSADIAAYTSIFSPTTSTSKAITALSSNARKGSIRSVVAQNLSDNRVFPATITIPKFKTHVNPYLDLWSWSCHNLEWCGPDAGTSLTKQSHHVLPIFYHHFGCVCPSYEALETIKVLAKGRGVLDIGSGNGYWTYMLRRHGLQVTAVDNGDSLWRCMWIGDTHKADGASFIAKDPSSKNKVLLLVYPQVTGDFTKSVLAKYQGDTIVVAGTQNKNGFTAFGDMTMDAYVQKEMPEWEKIVQTPLPSFAGKDEALFVFQKKS